MSLTEDVVEDISTSDHLPTSAKPQGINRNSVKSTYTTSDDTQEITTDQGIELTTTTNEFKNRASNSANQSKEDTTTDTGDASKQTGNLTTDSERDAAINGRKKTTRETVTHMDVQSTSNYPLEETQAWVEGQMDDVKTTAQEAHLQTETIAAATLVYFTTEGSSTGPVGRNTTGTLHLIYTR